MKKVSVYSVRNTKGITLKNTWILILLMGIMQSYGQSQESELPLENLKILEYVDLKMGKKVDRGECWDLAAFAMEHAGLALGNDPYDFGEIYDPKTEKMLPGDIIQFRKVKLKYESEDEWYEGSYPLHTAIVYKVISPTELIVAEQNGAGGRKVATDTLHLNWIVKGTVEFFRPGK